MHIEKDNVIQTFMLNMNGIKFKWEKRRKDTTSKQIYLENDLFFEAVFFGFPFLNNVKNIHNTVSEEVWLSTAYIDWLSKDIDPDHVSRHMELGRGLNCAFARDQLADEEAARLYSKANTISIKLHLGESSLPSKHDIHMDQLGCWVHEQLYEMHF